MDKTIKQTDTVIVGAGFSGLYLASFLLSKGYDDFLIVAPKTKTVSEKSFFNFRSRGIRQNSLKSSMIETGKGKNNFQLVNVLVNNIDDELTHLDGLAKLKPSFMGVQVIDPAGLMKKLKESSKEHRLDEVAVKIAKEGNRFAIRTNAHVIKARQVVFCLGGQRDRFSKFFADEKVPVDGFGLAKSIGCKTRMLDKMMFHPFYAGAVCLPSDNLADFEIIDDQGRKLLLTNNLLKAHNAHHCFDEILAEFKKAKKIFALKGKTRIEITPQPHYLLGGIVINRRGRTSVRNVYALGECSFGMHGHGRIGGCALSEIIVMARVIADQLCHHEL
ncbi:MAG: FAD-binding protein [Candidatus Pacebacteria bacterium]|nr:FAD-binding protein [Candidatus Paceibacterota bacterium]